MSVLAKKIVVIGGGHNGLTCAILLRQSGWEVTVLEARDQLGGLAAETSFGHGFRVPGILHDTSLVRTAVVEGLGLAELGLKRMIASPTIFAPNPGGEDLWIKSEDLAGSATVRDKGDYAVFKGFIERVRPVARRLMDRPPLDPKGPLRPLMTTGVAVRRLGAPDMMELLRVAPMCVADWMRDSFKSERLMAALALPAVEGSWAGPWSAHTATSLLLRTCLTERPIQGGPAALAKALVSKAELCGVTLRREAKVSRIIAPRGSVRAVILDDGEEIGIKHIASAVDPKKTFLDFIGIRCLPDRLAEDVRKVRCRGTTAKVHLGIKDELRDSNGRPIEVMRTGATLDEIERAFDAVKYRNFAECPVLEVTMPSQTQPNLAPAGHNTLSIMAHFAAYNLEGGWTEDQTKALGEAVINALDRACPGIAQKIVAKEVLSPADLEARYGLTEGHIFHGEHAPDQLLFMRPTHSTSGYISPIKGLYLCGSGSHPGGGLTCMPGYLAAKAIQALD